MRLSEKRHEAGSHVGAAFVFINRRRSHLKALSWDRNGFALFYKRPEAGTFELPKEDMPTWPQMVMLLKGVSLKSVRAPVCG